MKKHNKGEIHNVLVLILIIASAIVLFLILSSFNKSTSLDQEIKTCHLSVIAQSSTSFGIVTKSSPLDIQCDKRYVDFYNTKIERGLSLENMDLVPVIYGSREVKKFNELNENMVYQIISEELRVCKYQFGDGRIKIFPNDDEFLKDKRICFVCSEINFKEGVKKQDFLNLRDFTQNNKIPDKEYTYYDYLTEQTVYGDPMWSQIIRYDSSALDKTLNISTSESYLIVLKKNSYSTTKTFLGVINSPILAFLTELRQDGIFLTIVPATEINKYCDIQAS